MKGVENIGRPRKEIKKDKLLTMRVSSEDMEILKALSNAYNLPLSKVLMLGVYRLYEPIENLAKTQLNNENKK